MRFYIGRCVIPWVSFIAFSIAFFNPFLCSRHHTNFRLSSPSLLSKYFRHQKAKEAREEILERHGPEVSPQPKVLQEAQ
jgi:hypothetical protein|tara:strand:- start:569 stop:805 length:237 start_codon:yes stop_codon:yes gene_type:complete